MRKIRKALVDLSEINKLRIISNQKELIDDANRKQVFCRASKYAGVKLFDACKDFEKSAALLEDVCGTIPLCDILEEYGVTFKIDCVHEWATKNLKTLEKIII